MCGNQELHRLIYFDVLSGGPSWSGLRLYTVLCCVLRRRFPFYRYQRELRGRPETEMTPILLLAAVLSEGEGG